MAINPADALTAGGIIGGSLIGAGSQRRTNEEMMNFAYNMSSTQYQRAVEDMRAAGLNPVLAAGTGGASSSTPSLQAPGRDLASSFANAARTIAIDVPQAQANINQQEANTKVAQEEATNRVHQRQLIDAQTRATKANARGTEAGNVEKETKAEVWDMAKTNVKGLKQAVKDAGKPQHDKGYTKNKDGSWSQGGVTIPKGTKDWQQLENAAKGRTALTPSEAYATGAGAVYGGNSNAKRTP